MKRLLTAAQMRAVERNAEKLGVAGSALMNSAGFSLAAHAVQYASPTGRFCVMCGSGNNGGDGRVAAEILKGWNREVWVDEKGARVLSSAVLQRGDLVIDALLGTGLNRAPTGEYADRIRQLMVWKTQGAFILSADLPSGIHPDTGRKFSPSVVADACIAFGSLKVSHAVQPGKSSSGDIQLDPIGIPPAAEEGLPGLSVFELEEEDIRRHLRRRDVNTHKGSFGHVLVIAGSVGKSGAAALASIAALRSGAGRVTVGSRSDCIESITAHAPELMGHALGSKGAWNESDVATMLEAAQGKQSVIVGPGIARGEGTAECLFSFFRQLTVPGVLDADGLNAVADAPEELKQAGCDLVLTPHPGEAARLLKKTPAEIQGDRVNSARSLAILTGCIVVLKGAQTVISDLTGNAFINPTGNPGMATAGTGDVLAGIIAALLALGLEPLHAAQVGVYAHGLSGDLQSAKFGQMGLVASDLFRGLGEVWNRWGV